MSPPNSLKTSLNPMGSLTSLAQDSWPDISGYVITDKLHVGPRTAVYRAVQSGSQRPVVIKVLRQAYPSFGELVQFRNQYTITKNLPIPGIVQPLSLEPLGSSYALVLEDWGGVSLCKYTQQGSLNLVDILTIALQIADILHDLSQHQVVHKDIKPANILIHPESKQVKLIDFSIASLLPKETQKIQSPNVLEGTLAYLAPEQTGRMNRGIDYRADFYALGVTLYQLLSGSLPFTSDDPLELVHCHIAKMPVPVNQVNSAVSEMVAAIVAKLMAKNAEDRYQSAIGLKHDLQQCLTQWQETQEIQAFELGQRDLSDRFTIPEKLYGRETEVQALLEAFERVAKGSSELMLVAGFSGIGKTAIVNEVHKPITRQNGYFLKGKFDQFNRDIPFSAFVQAFRGLVAQLLTERDDNLQIWKTQILDAVGESGQVIIEVIPELERVIGSQPLATELSGTAAQNRFNLLFQKFIQVFTTSEHPLVMFLDDLQWADSDSLSLIQVLMAESKIGYLLLIGAYRDNEVFAAHPLMLTLDIVSKAGATVNTISLQPLSQDSLNQLVADTLHCEEQLAQPLTELVMQKTQGNPFFATQFLKALHQENLITFDADAGYWQCDIVQVWNTALTDDVVEFMAMQLQKLPETTQAVLKLAACIGAQFDLETLAIVSQQSPAAVATHLWRALQQGLVLPQSEIYKFYLENPEVSEAINHEPLNYKFLHDRVQQAAYSLISEEQKQTIHLQIGRLLRHKIPEEKWKKQIFEIVNPLNFAIDLITTADEQIDLARLNLLAGRKAKDATAYEAALKYFTLGRSLLSPDCWTTQYELMLGLHINATEAAYLSKDFDQMEQLAEIVLQQAQTLLDGLKIYEIKIQAYQDQGNLSAGVATALSFLASLKVHLPLQPTHWNVWHKKKQMQWALIRKPVHRLLDLPTMQDPNSLAAMQILAAVLNLVVFSNPGLGQLVVLQLLSLSLKGGNTAISAEGYTAYAGLLCNKADGIDLAYQFGQLALTLLSRCDHRQSTKATVLFQFNILIRHWKEHWRATLSPLLEAYQTGLDAGNFGLAAHSVRIYCVRSYFVGKELSELSNEMAIYLEVMTQLKQVRALTWHRIYWQSIANLRGETNNPGQLIGEYFNETEMSLSPLIDDRMAAFTLCCNKLILNYLLADYQTAQEQAEIAKRYLSRSFMSIDLILFDFYDCLTQLQLSLALPKSQRQQISQVDTFQAQLQQWAVTGPMNFQHKLDLLAAEQAHVKDCPLQAIELYDRAIAGAKANEYIQEEALANELAAKFYLNWGKEKVAAGYMQEAYYCYARWGAKAKTDDLETRYPQLLQPILQKVSSTLSVFETLTTLINPASFSQRGTSQTSSDNRSLSHSLNEVLDLAALLQVSQAISSTIDLDELLQTLTQTMLKTSGGDRCVLLLCQDNQWQIRASANFRETILESVPLENNLTLPIRLIQYVKNTSETVVITNLTTDLPGIIDDYLYQYQPKSILGLPILNQGNLVGILYLENSLVSDVFTRDRLLVLNFLCTQAAISLENARLYQQSKDVIQQQQQALQSINQSQAELNQTKRMLQLVIDNIPGGVFWKNLNSVYLGCNQHFATIGGLNSVDQIINKTDYDLPWKPEESDFFQECDRKIMDSGIAEMGIVEPILQANGTQAWVETNKIPLRDRQNNIIGIIGTFQDITARKQAEKIILQKTQDLEQALTDLQESQLQIVQSEKMASLGNLVAGVAHEINNPIGFLNVSIEHLKGYIRDLMRHLELYQQHYPNPIAAIQDNAQQVDLEFLSEDLPKLVNSMMAATDRIKGISISLRNFSRTDTEYKVSANLNEGIDSTLLILKYRLKANEHRPEIQVDQAYGELPLIQCFPGQLNQVFMNILANAIDMFDEAAQQSAFTDLKANPQIITIQTALTEQNTVEIRIIDNGKGMSEDVRARIFDHLFTTKGVGKGTGLGLAIARQIILEKHGGGIEVSSMLNQGTAFCISLPIFGE